MPKNIVAGNWKMHGDKASNRQLLSALTKAKHFTTEIVVFPPSIYIGQVADILVNSNIAWGAQNVSHENNGAFTGEISTTMLQDFACQYVLVGHSERRHLYGETNDIVAKKFVAAKQAGLIPILCLGETLQERQQDKTEVTIQTQLEAVLAMEGHVQQLLANTILAYEPVWAIGTGETATPEQAQQVHRMLRTIIGHHDEGIAAELSILYGGSVKAHNAQALANMNDVDGFLVGGASLKAEEFIGICRCKF